MWLIDWEFAAAADGFYDLATIAIAAGLDAEGERMLRAAYCGPGRQDRLADARWSVAFFEGSWALAVHTSDGSDGDFDFAGHASRMFESVFSDHVS